MAGVYISGIDIPSCGRVVFIRGDGRVTTEFGEQVIGRAIEVQTHGDLIDRDETLELLQYMGNRDYRREKGTIADAMKMIRYEEYTPAVIKSDKLDIKEETNA